MMILNGKLVPFADGIWTASMPMGILGMKLSATMAVLRLEGGGLLLYSPIEMTEACREAVEAVGRVEHLYAPNLFHHLRLGEWAEAYPDAQVHGPPGLAKKRPDLRIDRVHGSAPSSAFGESVEELRIEGFRLEESALLYKPTGTLVVADLVHNIGQPTGGWTRFYTKLMGFYDRVAISRAIRWTSFSDKKAARQSIDALFAHSFDSLVVGHGMPIKEGAKEALQEAYLWL